MKILVFVIAQLFSIIPAIMIQIALTATLPSVNILATLSNRHWRTEELLGLVAICLAFEAIYWWFKHDLFGGEKDRFFIIKYMAIPAALPAIVWLVFSGMDDTGGMIPFLPRESDIAFAAAFGLIGGLVVRGILVISYKATNNRTANIAAIAIAAIMLAMSL